MDTRDSREVISKIIRIRQFGEFLLPDFIAPVQASGHVIPLIPYSSRIGPISQMGPMGPILSVVSESGG